jgi:glutaredoxin
VIGILSLSFYSFQLWSSFFYFEMIKPLCRITLFTRTNCSLCEDAKTVLSKVWEKRRFNYREIGVMQSGMERWKAMYEFDVPVVSQNK